MELPTKQQIIDALKEEKPKGFSNALLIIEHKKVSEFIGVIKGELIQNDKIILKGRFTQLPKTTEESFDWDALKDGDSYFDGYTLDYRGESILEMIKSGFKKGLKEGKIPFVR